MATKDTKKASVPAAKPGQKVRIVNRGRDGYRRGGVAHAKGAADHAHDRFSTDQLDAIKGDATLEVSIVDASKDGPAA